MNLHTLMIFLVCVTRSLCVLYEDLKVLEDDLLKGYSPHLRPVNQSSDTVLVGVELSLIKIVELDVTKEVMVTCLKFRVTWTDQRLGWDDEKYSDIKMMIVPRSKVWTPDLHVLGSSQKDNQLDGHRVVQVSPFGEVRWNGEIETRTWCSMNVHKFPFDKQTCSITISTMHSNDDAVNITHVNSTDSDIVLNGDWEMKSSWLQRQSLEKDQQTWSGITLNCVVERHSTYYIYTVLMPVLAVFVVNPFVFLVKAGSGEKISTAVTLFLSFTIFISLLSDMVPQTSSSMPYVYNIVYYEFQLSASIVINVIVTSRFNQVCRFSAFKTYIARLFRCKKEKEVTNVMPFPDPTPDTERDESSKGGTLGDKSRNVMDLVEKTDRMSFYIYMFVSVMFVASAILTFSQ